MKKIDKTEKREPVAVKDTHDIERIRREFNGLYGVKLQYVWDLGLNLALRISDLLSIQYSDIDMNNRRVRLIEKKTGKVADIKLNDKAMSVIKVLRELNPNDVYLFQSQANRTNEVKPLSRQYVTKAFKEVGDSLGIVLGTHSMRKTRGYHQYKKNNNIASVTKMLRHSSPAVTMAYIGITQEEIDNDFDELEL